MYLLLLKAHVGLILLSFLSFALRTYWGYRGSVWLESELAFKAYKVITLTMLLSALVLCVTINQYPFTDAWLTEKLLLLVAYVACAMLAFKPKLNRQLRNRVYLGYLHTVCDDFLHRENACADCVKLSAPLREASHSAQAKDERSEKLNAAASNKQGIHANACY
nr:SirB2 family protein [Vibrio cidicii]